MSEQTTPRTVEEAARVIALLDDAITRVPKIGGANAIYEAELLAVLRAAREVQAARMPSVEEVEAAMDEADRTDVAFNLLCGCGAYTSARHRRCRAERVVALWGAP